MLTHAFKVSLGKQAVVGHGEPPVGAVQHGRLVPGGA